MRWHRIRPTLRLVLSVLGLAALLSLGMTAPRAPSAEEMRTVSYVLAGGSFADICGSGGHPSDEERCQHCCLAAMAPAPTAPRTAVRRVRLSRGVCGWCGRRRPRAIRRDPTRTVRAPPAV